MVAELCQHQSGYAKTAGTDHSDHDPSCSLLPLQDPLLRRAEMHGQKPDLLIVDLLMGLPFDDPGSLRAAMEYIRIFLPDIFQNRVENIHVIQKAHDDRAQMDQKPPDKIFVTLEFIGNRRIEDLDHLIDHIQKLFFIDSPHLTHDDVIAGFFIPCRSGVGDLGSPKMKENIGQLYTGNRDLELRFHLPQDLHRQVISFP